MNDDTQTTRVGEELNEAALREFLQRELPAMNADLHVKQFPAGSSNLTYLIEFGAREFVLRRPPFGNTVKTAHDMNREFRVLEKLAEVYEPAPRPVLFCADENVIGAEFYLMERKQGVVLRGLDVPETLRNSPELQRAVCTSFVDNLAELHNLDYAAIGLGDLGKPEGYTRRQVEGWTKRYLAAQTDALPELEGAMAWLNATILSETERAALVHNDYKFDNVMLDETDLTKIVGVLDWEMCTIGDPLMDLGTTLGYWMSHDAPEFMRAMPFNPQILMHNFTRQELAARYHEKTNADVSNLLFYYVFGTFKIAVIAQQIYARYVKGLTKDERFARFDSFIRALGQIAARSLEKGEI